MSMTSAMEDVWYNRRDFNVDHRTRRHPMWITEKFYIYHLKKDGDGFLECIKNDYGLPVKSPR